MDDLPDIPKEVMAELLPWMVFDFVLKYIIWAGIILTAVFIFPDYTKQLLSWIHPGLVDTAAPLFMIMCWALFLTLTNLIKGLMQPLLILLGGEELNSEMVQFWFVEHPVCTVIYNPIYYSIAGLYIWWVVVSPVIAISAPIGVVCLIWWKWRAGQWH